MRRYVGLCLILLGMATLALGFTGFKPFLVFRTPTYVADAIILYDDAFPTLTYDAEIGKYKTRLYYEVNFQPLAENAKYYYLVEVTDANASFIWMLFFYNVTTGGLEDGVGSWFITEAGMPKTQRWAGIEIEGYTLIKWTWRREGLHYMLIDLKSEHAEIGGRLKVYIKWETVPPPTYEITITKIEAELNQPIVVEGKITPAIGGKQIVLTITYPSGRTETRFFLTYPDGTFKYSDPALKATETGTYTVQATVDTSTSQPKTFTIEKPTLKWEIWQTAFTVIGVTFILAGAILWLRGEER